MITKTHQIKKTGEIEDILAECQEAIDNGDYPTPDYKNRKVYEITRKSCLLPRKFLRYMGVN